MGDSLLSRLAPSITNMIRVDHTHVQTAIRQYEVASSMRVKKGIADNICLALEIHSQLEEEIFYPALRLVSDTETLRKAGPEHNEMRELIARLRAMQASDAAFDDTFYALARVVMHHVADEETILLPCAERLLSDRLGEMGAEMTKRRFELTAPRTGELAGSVARSMSVGTVIAAAGALAAGGWLLTRGRTADRPWSHRIWSR
ncbi:MAG TPA: hemerythrin domain-containing protein [Ramlibacter sp.]|uniref:hemerythrin domain-containing protein n=1 Tax=Ramlibacter sp. TaxID=1917967 RepID=UPI002C20BA81|nr:hemerythrin domain-containing protein [Ramlibacter sp.]HVZ45118.1 hemerythrin domain-containing protein [Ramlibacter sp.]